MSIIRKLRAQIISVIIRSRSAIPTTIIFARARTVSRIPNTSTVCAKLISSIAATATIRHSVRKIHHVQIFRFAAVEEINFLKVS